VSRSAAALAALGVLAAAGDAEAFCRSTTCRSSGDKECATDDDGCATEGAKLFWPTSCVSYATNALGTVSYPPEETRKVLRKTFQAWSDVPCPDGTRASMTFEEREPVSCHESEYDKKGPNVNVVLFEDNDWKYRGIDGTLAKTSVTYNDVTGEIYDADIAINAAYNEITITDDPAKARTDLQAIVTHEVGHFIGLAHSPAPDAVMNAEYAPGSLAQRTLTGDDVRAVCAAYPADRGAPCNTEPRGGFGPTCDDPKPDTLCSTQPGGAASYGVSGLVLGAGLLAVRARRRSAGARAAAAPPHGGTP
jgi:hypothetical protein